VRIANEFILDEIGGIRGVDLILRRAEGESVRDPAFLKKVDTLQEWIEAIPEVTRTVSLVNILKSMNRSLNNDNLKDYVVPQTIEAVSQFLLLYTMSLPDNADLDHLVTDENDALHITILWTLSDSVAWIATEDKILDHARTLGLTPTITGKGTIFQHLGPYLIETFVESMSIALILMSVLLVFIFRSLRLGLLALVTNCIPLVGGAAIFYLAGRSVDFGSVLVASVCLGIAVDDTIHILSNYERLRRQGISPYEAMIEVLEHTAPALVITTIILVAGFGTLAFGNFVPNVYFGIMTAVILVFALVTDVIFLPAWMVKNTPEEGLVPGDGI
jgi:predicted RND superfamily exporter protein